MTDDSGWVLIPALIMLSVSLVLGLALLALVDRQTSEAAAKRTTDAAQALADGVVASTASALATMDTTDGAMLAAAWPAVSSSAALPCTVITGDLTSDTATAAPQGETPEQTLTRRVRSAVKRYFDENDSTYARANASATKWSANICPDRGSAAGGDVWDDRYLTTPLLTAAVTSRRAVWVHAQADVRSTAGKVSSSSRAAAAKVRQSTTPFVPPTNIAVGTASFATDLSTSLVTTVQNGAVGKLVLGGLLGLSKKLVDDDPSNANADGGAKIGLRCGILDALNNPGLNLCVGGALGGVNSVVGTVTNTLGLGSLGSALGGILGIDRTVNLSGYTIAPPRALAAFKAEAITKGIYLASVPGGLSGTTSSCLAGATKIPDATTIVYIDRVGTGDEYCRIPPGTNARAFVIGSGRARVTGTFNGVLYAANLQEIGTATTPAAIDAARKSAPVRETIRVEYPGTVNGAVWTDGAGGQVGLYPPAANPNSAALLQVGGAQGICSLPLIGPVLSLVDGVLTPVLKLVGNLLELVTGYQTEVRTVGNETTDCGLLKRVLGNLTSSQLVSLFGSGQSNVNVPISEQRTRSCKTWLVVCLAWNDWSDWTPRDSKSVNIPSLLDNLSAPTVLSQLLGTLTGITTNWTAVSRNVNTIKLATVGMPVGAEVAPGTYRTVSPKAALITGGQ